MTTAPETVLMRLRTHPKVLFKPVIIQIALIAAHIAVYRYFPASTGFAWADEWGQLTVHGIIVLIELTYVVLPALRWWNSEFIVSNRRLEEHWGVLYRNAREIPLDRIASVTTERGILDRIFGCGTLVVHDAGLVDLNTPQQRGLSQRSSEGRVGVRFSDVPHVHKVREAIDRVRFEGRA